MKTCIVLVLCVAAAVAVPFVDDSLDEEWGSFKATYNKTYVAQEEAVRRLIWEQNVRIIKKHNLQADMGKFAFWLGINKYADMSNDEFRRLMNGAKYDARTAAANKDAITFLPPENVQLPDTVDWRTRGYVTPVKDQGVCGSCWTFSATGSLEGQHFKKTGVLTPLSQQNLVDCTRYLGNRGCNGGSMHKAFEYIQTNGGIDTDAAYPYTARDGLCYFNTSAVGATDTGYVEIAHYDEAALQVAVATIGPISVNIDASHSSFNLYQNGVYDEILCRPLDLDHAVLVVGYGVFEGKDYWLVKNSYGTSWGMKGYIMMSRNKLNQCGIATIATYPTV